MYAQPVKGVRLKFAAKKGGSNTMKIKKVNKKLVLNKTTVSNLNNAQLGRVKAGEENTVPLTCESCLVCPTEEYSCVSCDFSCVGYPCLTDYCTENCTNTCNESVKTCPW
jgi:hypothetical protein